MNAKELEQAIESAYRSAVFEMPYRSVSVKGLCEQLGITRKVFYRRFDGKDDVFRWLFDRDVVNPQLELYGLLTYGKVSVLASNLEQRVYDAVFADGDFYRAFIGQEQTGREAFLEVTSAAFRAFNGKLLEYAEFKGSAAEAEYVASFFAIGRAFSLLQWICNGFDLQPEEMSAAYLRVVKPFWETVVRKS